MVAPRAIAQIPTEAGESPFWAVAQAGPPGGDPDAPAGTELPRVDRKARPAPLAVDVEANPAARSQIEEVVVTGSLVSRDINLGSIAPVQVLSKEDFQATGEFNLASALNDIPALLTSSTPRGNNGRSFLALRALGAERTLTLVDGRRHVPGAAGTTAVDLASIPDVLVERVEVLTGGASSLYGADAVTGVVNLILRNDFEGFDLSFQAGAGARNLDGETVEASAVWGRNFMNGRANLTLAGTVIRSENVRASDRDIGFGGIGAGANPALRFQRGDIDSASTPNFARFFAPGAPGRPRFPVGTPIPRSADAFRQAFEQEFMEAPELTPEELALIERADKAPPRAFRRGSTFSISSPAGIIRPRSFENVPSLDLNGNGVDDCLDSFVGFQSTQAPIGGCFQVGRDGRVAPLRDGRVSSSTMQFLGPGTRGTQREDFLAPEEDRYALNATARFDLTEFTSLFGEAKLAFSQADNGGPLNSFSDLLEIRPDNPFIPGELRELAEAGGGLLVTRDHADLGSNIDTNERTTYRFVGGARGELQNGWNWEVSANYGKVTGSTTDRDAVIQDRFFAALDAVEGPDGEPVCRSELDPGALPPGSLSGVPEFTPGFFTFRPGEGRCAPANILGGRFSISPAARNFITTTNRTRSEISQTVFAARMTGLLPPAFDLPGGEIAFAVGAEYREERSRTRFGPLTRGLIPPSGPEELVGQRVGALPGVTQRNLLFNPEVEINDSGGSFDVEEAFAELQLPLLRDLPFFSELTADVAARVSRYSTIGSTFTFNYGGTWAPVPDIRFRSTFAEAVRAPNIVELFSPDQGAFFRPLDPCEQAQVDALKASGDPRGAIRERNCRAAGIPEGFTDPLTAQFAGISGGNPDLEEETGRTFTAGVVVQPRFLDGLSFSIDYFDIEVEGAIQSVGSNNILEACFDSAGFPGNEFCNLFSRDMDPSSPTFLGLSFLRQTQINFAKLETSGIDFGVRYAFSFGQNDVSFSLTGTRTDKLNEFFDPTAPGSKDPALGESGVPRLSGSARLGWRRGGLALSWQTQYRDEEALGGVDIETVKTMFGFGTGISSDFLSNDVSMTYTFGEGRYSFYAGANSVNSGGRFLFTGLRAFF